MNCREKALKKWQMTALRAIGCISGCGRLALLCLCILSDHVAFLGVKRTVLGWQQARTRLHGKKQSYDYDLVVIGAGASGLFASGAASSLGSKTLLLDQAEYVGGDCSNAACVPSKAVRSVARMANARNDTGKSWLALARQHSIDTVSAVRQRENAADIADRNPNLDLVFVRNCRFISPHELELKPRNASNVVWDTSPSPNGTVTLTSKAFLIATGASPIVPRHLELAAKEAGVPIHTYRSVLQPPRSNDQGLSFDDRPESIWNMMKREDYSGNTTQVKHVVIAGGGPTACELGQSLARLGGPALNITIVAPDLLPNEDVTLRRAAMKVLTNDGIRLCLGSRVTNVIRNKDSAQFVVLDDGRISIPVNALLLCLGRSPATSLSELNLEAAGVKWNPEHGVEVHSSSLRSKSASHVYACGDCCDAVQDRRAAHAAWTGFHAARNTILPFWLRMGSQAVHPTVPGVVYTDPELASVGLSYIECIRQYGKNGFACLYVPEVGMDRADMDRLERPVVGFIELRATKIGGKVLGMTACGPAAAELANEVGLVITSGLTVRDLARSIHSYPSHGYLMHRIALALATSNVWGLLSACGPVGKLLGSLGRVLWCMSLSIKPSKLVGKKTAKRTREWEAEGAKKAILIGDSNGLVQKGDMDFGKVQLLSYLEVYKNESLLYDIYSRGLVNGDHPSSSEEHSGRISSHKACEGVFIWAQRKPP